MIIKVKKFYAAITLKLRTGEQINEAFKADDKESAEEIKHDLINNVVTCLGDPVLHPFLYLGDNNAIGVRTEAIEAYSVYTFKNTKKKDVPDESTDEAGDGENAGEEDTSAVLVGVTAPTGPSGSYAPNF